MRIITADERMAEVKGSNILLLGEYGTGKTRLFGTLPNIENSLFVDIEAGELTLKNVRGDHIRPETWTDLRDIACLIGGPNRSFDDQECYSEAHYDALVEKHGENTFEKYENIFVDSISDASPICFRWCERQPENIAKNGNKDTRGAYGMLGREMTGWLRQLQKARSRSIILAAKLNQTEDDFGRKKWVPEIMGQTTANQMPGILDHVLTLCFLDEETAQADGIPASEDGKYRALVTKKENPWGYPAKVRDPYGVIDRLEKADLTSFLEKLTRQPASNDAPATSANTAKNEEKAA